MLDLVAMKALYEKLTGREMFADAPKEGSKSSSGGKTGLTFTIVFGLIYLSLAIWAATLSWSSNTIAGWSAPAKVFFSLFAFIGAIQYLSTHFIHKLDLLMVIPVALSARQM